MSNFVRAGNSRKSNKPSNTEVRLPDGTTHKFKKKMRVHQSKDMHIVAVELGIVNDEPFFFLSKDQEELSLLPCVYPTNPSHINDPIAKLFYLFHLCEKCMSKCVQLENPRDLVDIKLIHDVTVTNRNGLQTNADDALASRTILDSIETVNRLLNALLSVSQLTTEVVSVKDPNGMSVDLNIRADGLQFRPMFQPELSEQISWSELGEARTQKSTVRIPVYTKLASNSLLASFVAGTKLKRGGSFRGSVKKPKRFHSQPDDLSSATTRAESDEYVELTLSLPDSSSAERLAYQLCSVRNYAIGISNGSPAGAVCAATANGEKTAPFSRMKQQLRDSLRRIKRVFSKKKGAKASSQADLVEDETPELLTCKSELSQKVEHPSTQNTSVLPSSHNTTNLSSEFSNIPSGDSTRVDRPPFQKPELISTDVMLDTAAAGEAEVDLTECDDRYLKSLLYTPSSTLYGSATANISTSAPKVSPSSPTKPTYLMGIKPTVVSPFVPVSLEHTSTLTSPQSVGVVDKRNLPLTNTVVSTITNTDSATNTTPTVTTSTFKTPISVGCGLQARDPATTDTSHIRTSTFSKTEVRASVLPVEDSHQPTRQPAPEHRITPKLESSSGGATAAALDITVRNNNNIKSLEHSLGPCGFVIPDRCVATQDTNSHLHVDTPDIETDHPGGNSNRNITPDSGLYEPLASQVSDRPGSATGSLSSAVRASVFSVNQQERVSLTDGKISPTNVSSTNSSNLTLLSTRSSTEGPKLADRNTLTPVNEYEFGVILPDPADLTVAKTSPPASHSAEKRPASLTTFESRIRLPAVNVGRPMSSGAEALARTPEFPSPYALPSTGQTYSIPKNKQNQNTSPVESSSSSIPSVVQENLAKSGSSVVTSRRTDGISPPLSNAVPQIKGESPVTSTRSSLGTPPTPPRSGSTINTSLCIPAKLDLSPGLPGASASGIKPPSIRYPIAASETRRQQSREEKPVISSSHNGSTSHGSGILPPSVVYVTSPQSSGPPNAENPGISVHSSYHLRQPAAAPRSTVSTGIVRPSSIPAPSIIPPPKQPGSPTGGTSNGGGYGSSSFNTSFGTHEVPSSSTQSGIRPPSRVPRAKLEQSVFHFWHHIPHCKRPFSRLLTLEFRLTGHPDQLHTQVSVFRLTVGHIQIGRSTTLKI
ncbi:hypothetical protein EG68_05604 [Paragonimus skrjabini miyazakii]|uniref:Uncharacterized protein n=1 Tax=Paragonimus skrjabini miyazakii TaxID=59628 RepID=A0A8S9YL47_9TREM|nr:hypothetical protein EG68_05604 [Paragonimus skrjabini miyazakii]